MNRVRVRRQPAGWAAVAAGIGTVGGIAAALAMVGLALAAVTRWLIL